MQWVTYCGNYWCPSERDTLIGTQDKELEAGRKIRRIKGYIVTDASG